MDDNEKAVCSGTLFTVEKISPLGGLNLGTCNLQIHLFSFFFWAF